MVVVTCDHCGMCVNLMCSIIRGVSHIWLYQLFKSVDTPDLTLNWLLVSIHIQGLLLMSRFQFSFSRQSCLDRLLSSFCLSVISSGTLVHLCEVY